MNDLNSSPVERLTGIRHALLSLHKVLLDSERAAYERDCQKIKSNGEFLNLVINDPWFSWLRRISELVVAIDERLDEEEPPTVEEAARLVQQTRTLLTPSETGTGFEKRYDDAMQRDPNIILAHADVVKLL
jgi:hypothetical protein